MPTPALQIPAPAESFDVTVADGAVFKVRRHGNPGGFRLYVSHGNGFAVDAYYPFWSLLCDRFDVVLFDMRNHGRNPPAGFDGHNYHRMSHDIGQVVEASETRFGAAPKAGVFHSMSGRAAMKHAVEVDWIWDALVLFDPPNVPLKDHPLYSAMRTFELRLVEFAANRQAQFEDVSQLAAYYAESRAHQKWVAGAHDLMACSVLRHDGTLGTWCLTCPPEYEASIYLAALTMDLWPGAGQYGGPVKLIGADPDFDKGPPTGPANAALAAEGGYDYQSIPGTGHMLQLEKPSECVDAAIAFLEAYGLSN
jgi:pimeloyl-ACP methyl ester carboxylesterase